MLRLTDRVGARTDRLRLERLDRPVLAHFPGNDAFDIVLEIHHVDDIDVPAAHALVFKAAVVAVAAEPRDRLFTRLDRQDAEVFAPTAVEFKEDRIRSHHDDRHARAAAADGSAAVLGCRGPRRTQARVAASARIELISQLIQFNKQVLYVIYCFCIFLSFDVIFGLLYTSS